MHASSHSHHYNMRNRNLANDPIDLFLGDAPAAIGRSEHSILPPALDGDTEDLAPENGLNVQDARNLVPGLVAVDPAAAGNGGQEPPNDRLQQTEQQDLQAVRNVLPGIRIRDNVITVRHCWMIVKKLRGMLSKEGPYRIPDSQAADYARILERLARVMTVPSSSDYEAAHCDHPLGYEALLQLLQERTPDDSCPVEYGECLDRLCEEMTTAASMIRGADCVYILKDRDEFASRLRSLAARLRRTV